MFLFISVHLGGDPQSGSWEGETFLSNRGTFYLLVRLAVTVKMVLGVPAEAVREVAGRGGLRGVARRDSPSAELV